MLRDVRFPNSILLPGVLEAISPFWGAIQNSYLCSPHFTVYRDIDRVFSPQPDVALWKVLQSPHFVSS